MAWLRPVDFVVNKGGRKIGVRGFRCSLQEHALNDLASLHKFLPLKALLPIVNSTTGGDQAFSTLPGGSTAVEHRWRL